MRFVDSVPKSKLSSVLIALQGDNNNLTVTFPTSLQNHIDGETIQVHAYASPQSEGLVTDIVSIHLKESSTGSEVPPFLCIANVNLTNLEVGILHHL